MQLSHREMNNSKERLERLGMTKITAMLSLMVCMLLPYHAVHAQTEQTIKIRMLDSKTGKPITASEFMVWTNHGPNFTWVKPDKEGEGEMTLPSTSNIAAIAVHATYGPANWSYVNCDSVSHQGSHPAPWYGVSDILGLGVVADNYCSKKRATAKPGEFVFFVRQMTFWEKMAT
jgi:hypothetical protein